jgi:hypothetical protein
VSAGLTTSLTEAARLMVVEGKRVSLGYFDGNDGSALRSG